MLLHNFLAFTFQCILYKFEILDKMSSLLTNVEFSVSKLIFTNKY